jgi:hypothetical protein
MRRSSLPERLRASGLDAKSSKILGWKRRLIWGMPNKIFAFQIHTNRSCHSGTHKPWKSREMALLIPDDAPAYRSSTDPMTVVVSGATLGTAPFSQIRMASVRGFGVSNRRLAAWMAVRIRPEAIFGSSE